MFRTFETLRGFGIRATDGDIGEIADLYFDDARWGVRYVVVDTGVWLPGRKVLLPPGCFGEPDTVDRRFPVALSRDRVKNAPGVDLDRPVSRQQEQALHAHYGWTPYWVGGAGPLWGAPLPMAGAVPPASAEPEGPETGPEEADGDPHLRSAREVEGYSLAASDGDIGSIEDFLIDHDWHVRYLVVDTGNWLPGRRVLIAPDWVRGIDWATGQAETEHTRDQVRSSPAYDPERILDRGFEEQIYGYYGRIPYWI